MSYRNVDPAPCFVPEPTSSLSKHAITLMDFSLFPFKNPCKDVYAHCKSSNCGDEINSS